MFVVLLAAVLVIQCGSAVAAATSVTADVVGEPGREQVQLIVDVPVGGQYRIDGVLTGHAPRLDLLEMPSPVELSRYEDLPAERTWSSTAELAAGTNALDLGWSLDGLPPGAYTLAVRIVPQGGSPIAEQLTVALGGLEVQTSGDPLVPVGEAAPVALALTNLYGLPLVGSVLQVNIETVAVSAGAGQRSLPVVVGDVRLPDHFSPGETVTARVKVAAHEPGSYLLRITVTDEGGSVLGRGVHRFSAVDATTLLPEAYPGQPLVGRLPIADWAYAASIGKIYNLTNILVLPRVLEEMKGHGVSVFSWGTHSAGDFMALPYYNHHAQAMGFATLGYTGALGLEDDRFLSRYPAAAEWVLRDRAGTMPRPWGGVPFAPASPYYEQYRAPFFRSVVEHLDGVFADISHLYDGTDYSPFSVAEFAETHPGVDPRSLVPGSDEYWRFNEWRYETVAQFAARVRDDVKAVRPSAVLSWNMAEKIGRIAWGRTFAIDPVRLGKVVDVPLVETNYVSGEPPWILGANARYYREAAPGKPVWVALTFEYPDSSLFTPAQVELTMAEIYANGASVYIDWTPVSETLNANTEWVRAVDRVFNFVQSHRDLFVHRETRSAARVAILFSQQSNDYWSNPGGVSSNPSYQEEFLAWYQLLLEEGIQADVVNYETLADAQTLEARYDVLVLPSAAALSDDQMAAVEAYLRAGGRVLSTFQTGTLDEHGHVRQGTQLWQRLGLPHDLDATTAEVVTHKVGGGTLVHVTSPVGRAYWQRNNLALRDRMMRAFAAAEVHAAKVVDIALPGSPDAQEPPMIESVVYEDEAGLVVHLVNWTTDVGDWHALTHSYQEGGRRFTPITQILRLEQIALFVKVPDGRQVLAVRYAGIGIEDQTLSFARTDGGVEVTLPELNSYGIVRLVLGD